MILQTLLIFACGTLIGAVCAYVGGKVFDDIVPRWEMTAMKRGIVPLAGRLAGLQKWRDRFIAHHNREMARRTDVELLATASQQRHDQTARAVLSNVEPVLQRHEGAIAGLVAANGDMEGFKAALMQR